MTTYYEILNVRSTATIAEIEAALDTQYNHWRRLVTHHDPNVVNEANQKLQVLEEARTALTNPAKRAAYDSAMNLGGAIGGLADPQVRIEHPVVTASRPLTTPQPAPGPAATRMDAWVCPKCQTPNPVNTQYCENCGSQIGVSCPSCNMLTRAAARFCSHCGVDVQKSRQEQEYTALAQQRQQQLQDIQSQISQYRKEIAEYEGLHKRVMIFWFNRDFTLFKETCDKKYGPMRAIITTIVGLLAVLMLCGGVFMEITEFIVWIFIYMSVILFSLFTNSMMLFLVKPQVKQKITELHTRIAELEQQARQLQSIMLSDNG